MGNDIKLKITIAKLIELSIENNEKIALQIVRSKGSIKLTVDESGKATLSSKGGVLTFKGDPALESMGLSVKFISVAFERNDDGTLKYSGSFKIGFATLFVNGRFDVERLILSCSGILCKAARALKNRNHILRNQELEEIMR